MMRNVIINKISVDKVNFFDITGYIDLENMCFQTEISIDKYNMLRNGRTKEEMIDANLYLIDGNDVYYSCIGCISSLKFNNKVFIKTKNINLIFENYLGEEKFILTNKITFKTSYPRDYLYGCYVNDFKINYTSSKTISINKFYDEEKIYLLFTIEYKNITKREKLDDVLYTILEIFYLIFGCIPKFENYIFYVNDIKVTMYQKIADKYLQNLKSGSNDYALSIIDQTVLTPKLIKDFQKFRKETKILYDIFMTCQNGSNYTELDNNILIQLIEGTYKTINKKSDELWKILDFYFINNQGTNNILNSKDLKKKNDKYNTPIFLYKAKQHRNYLSHLNMNENKEVFIRLENNYARFKLIMCLRLIYMQYLDINYEEERLKRLIDSINKWGKRNKIKI